MDICKNCCQKRKKPEQINVIAFRNAKIALCESRADGHNFSEIEVTIEGVTLDGGELNKHHAGLD